MDYRVIYGPDLEGLTQIVKLAMKEGWFPVGGVAVVFLQGQMSFYQAMTKLQEKSLADRLSYAVPAGVPTDYTSANTFQKIY
jgi:hypothetical protein